MADIEPAVLLGAVAGGNRVRDEKKAGRAFNSNVLNRRVRLAVRNLTCRTGGGECLCNWTNAQRLIARSLTCCSPSIQRCKYQT